VTGKRFFPHGSQRFVDNNSQCFMQAGIRIGVNGKDRNFSQVNKRSDKKCTDCCLAGPPCPMIAMVNGRFGMKVIPC